MYTLTRKLSVVCLTVVLSFLVYGCGGSSKQALITDVNLDMVTAAEPDLKPAPGTYPIQPGKTANAGDVTFACDAGGPSCEVTVDDDGNIVMSPSAEGMATAMVSDSAAARLLAEDERDAANMALEIAEGELGTANMNLATTQGALDTANMNLATTQGALDTANMNLDTANMNLDTANMNLDTANMNLDTANMNLATTQGERDAFEMRVTSCEDALATANMNLETAKGDLATANMNLATAQGALATAVAALAAEKLKFIQVVDMVTEIKLSLADGYDGITPDTYIIEAGAEKVVDDVIFECPTGVLPCVVIVTAVLTAEGDFGHLDVISLGGVATVGNTMAVVNTIAAIALYSPGLGEDDDIVILNVGNADKNVEESPTVTVSRETGSGGEIEIKLAHGDGGVTAEYPPDAVESGYEIDDWFGQTLNRDDEDVTTPQEATVYTNIDPATSQKLKRGGVGNAELVIPGLMNVYVLGDGEDVDDIISDMSAFEATYNGVSGTFKCPTDIPCTIAVDTVNEGGQVIINTLTGWTFVSEDYVESEATQDADYMYFGYWLQSPDPDEALTNNYVFATFFGGPVNAAGDAVVFEPDMTLTTRDDNDDPLTATYVGGAAGMYVTRKLQIKNQDVDPKSPGYTGRFTATATLTAHFGDNDDFDLDAVAGTKDRNNKIGGTITDFMDGTGTNLGFKVDLELAEIDATIGGTTDATFAETATSTVSSGGGTWNGLFYGPTADVLNAGRDEEDEMMASPSSTTPSGVAGDFNASSTYTAVVGAFAAERE